MKKFTTTVITALVSGAMLSGLSACNGNDQGGGNVGNDWVNDKSASPTPTPSTDPSATPSASPTPSPSSSPDASGLYTGPAELEPYVSSFVADGAIQGVDVTPDMGNPKLTIQIASLSSYGSSVIGLCETGTGLRRVTFSPTFWNSASETQRMLLAHHELGHCVLYRAHDSSLLSDGNYASIMYPIIMASSVYNNNSAYYQQELFSTAAGQAAAGRAAAASAGVPNIDICTADEIMK